MKSKGTHERVVPLDLAVSEVFISELPFRSNKTKQDSLIALGEVLLPKDLKPNILQCRSARRDRAHLGDPIPLFDPVRDLLVTRVRGVIGVREAPLVHGELWAVRRKSGASSSAKGAVTHDSSRLEDSADLVVASFPFGCVASGFD